jgi:trk system potassium uptake protein TrkA
VKIVIVGAGSIGSYLAGRLSAENQDVVLIENDPVRAAEAQSSLDILVVTGNGASPSVLESVDVADADLLIAVSSNDGVNLLACHTAANLGAKRTVARVEDPGLREGLSGLNVDVVIDPGGTAAHELVQLVQQGGVSDLVEFGGGALVLVGGMVQQGSWIHGRSLSDLRSEVFQFEWVAAVIVRSGTTIIGHGDVEIQGGDHLLMMVTRGHVEEASAFMGLTPRVISRAVILGSTHLAELTAQELLDSGLDVVVVDPDADRCRSLAESIGQALVINGELTDPATLREVGLNRRDAVLALTGWDEINILACLLSRALGAASTIARINNGQIRGLLSNEAIDATVSSRLAAANAILRFVRRGRIHSVATFADTEAEAIELEVSPTSKSIDQRILDLPLPDEVVVGGIIRGEEAFVPQGMTIIESGDVLIIFSLPSEIAAVESLFSE